MGPLGVVGDQIGVEVVLHGFEAAVELLPSHDSEVLVEQGSVQALDEAVGLGPADPGGAVFDLLDLEEQLKGMTLGPAAVFPAIVAEHG